MCACVFFSHSLGRSGRQPTRLMRWPNSNACRHARFFRLVPFDRRLTSVVAVVAMLQAYLSQLILKYAKLYIKNIEADLRLSLWGMPPCLFIVQFTKYLSDMCPPTTFICHCRWRRRSQQCRTPLGQCVSRLISVVHGLICLAHSTFLACFHPAAVLQDQLPIPPELELTRGFVKECVCYIYL
jgi:hypothetical protein